MDECNYRVLIYTVCVLYSVMNQICRQSNDTLCGKTRPANGVFIHRWVMSTGLFHLCKIILSAGRNPPLSNLTFLTPSFLQTTSNAQIQDAIA